MKVNATRSWCCFMMGAAVIVPWQGAHGQSRALVETAPASEISVTVDIAAMSSFGPISGSDTATAPVVGTALLTLFPADPPFTHCTVHSMSLSVGQLDLVYRVVFVIELKATLTNLTIQSTGPFHGTIDAAGNLYFPEAPLRITGTAHIFSAGLGIDETLPVEADTTEPFGGLLVSGDGFVIMGAMTLPPVQWDVPPDALPSGITALEVTVDADISSVALSGLYGPAMMGDGDADDDIDGADWSDLVSCLTSPGEPSPVPCGLFRFDDDDDVDLVDAADFLTVFTGPS